MFSLDKRLAVVPILVGLGLAATAVANGATQTATNAPIQCGVVTHTDNGSLFIEAVVLGKSALTGSYKFSLDSTSGGSSNTINQASDFSARANEVTTLSQVSINAGSRYDLDFTITVGGKKYDCNQGFDYRT